MILIVAVVVIVASMVIYYVAKRPELAAAFRVDVLGKALKYGRSQYQDRRSLLRGGGVP